MKLTKNKKDGMIAGVCKGLSEKSGIPAWILRLLFICGNSISLIAYIVLACILDDKEG